MSKLDQILVDLPDTESQALRDVLESAAGHKEIAATLQRHDHDVSETAVRRWRSKHVDPS